MGAFGWKYVDFWGMTSPARATRVIADAGDRVEQERRRGLPARDQPHGLAPILDVSQPAVAREAARVASPDGLDGGTERVDVEAPGGLARLGGDAVGDRGVADVEDRAARAAQHPDPAAAAGAVLERRGHRHPLDQRDLHRPRARP